MLHFIKSTCKSQSVLLVIVVDVKVLIGFCLGHMIMVDRS